MSTETQPPNRPHFAVWRWHFYAGLSTNPSLITLALSGLVTLALSLAGLADAGAWGFRPSCCRT